MYVCRNIISFTVWVFLTDRSISVTDSPTPGRPFRATCEMVVPDNLEATVQVMLFDPAGQEVASATGLNSAEAVFLLASLQESDLGEYRCTSTVFSNQLNSPVIAERTFSVDSKYADYQLVLYILFPLFVQWLYVRMIAHSAVAS